MKETFEINAVPRSDQGKGASRRLRRSGLVPGIIYGGNKEPEMIATAHNELIHHLDNEAFYSHILNVKVGGANQQVVLKDLQRHPAKPFILHFDLLRVAGGDRIKMHVPLHFIGEKEAPGVRAGGQVSHALADVEIVCQAKDLPEYIEVDVSALNIGDNLLLSDLKLPEGLELPALAHGPEYDVPVVSVIGKPSEMEEEEGEGEGPSEEA
jgi:large subunit ribosomal protein L25